MTDLGDYAYALEYRRAMEGIVRDVLATDSPAYRYAKVVNVDYLNGKCEVLYPGEVATNVVNLNSIRPIEPDQWVRIEGQVGDKYVADVQDGKGHYGGEFLFNEPLQDPTQAQDILAAVNGAGLLTFTGQTSGKMLLSLNEGTGEVIAPGFSSVASGAPRIINDTYLTTAAAFSVGATELLMAQQTFTAVGGHRYRYVVKMFFASSVVSNTTWFKRVRYNSGTTVSTSNSVIFLDQHYSPNNLGSFCEWDVPLPRTLTDGQIYTVGASLITASGGGTLDRSVDGSRPLISQIIDDGT